MLVPVVLLILLVPALRNVALWPVMPRTWRSIPTVQLLRIIVDKTDIYEVDTYSFNCSNVRRKDERQARETFNAQYHIQDHLNLVRRAKTWARSSEDRWAKYSRYLPQITAEDKARLIRTWRVLDRACREHNLIYFLVEGTLLGAYRHAGIIPWDDDIDVAMEASEWKKIMRVLSCIPGYKLKTNPNFHWKFYPDDANENYYPFVDIFLANSDGVYTWAVASYIRYSTAYRNDDIYPLKDVLFEGYMTPVPKDLEKTARALYDVGICHSPWHNHKTEEGFSGSQVSKVPCHELSDVYTMHNV